MALSEFCRHSPAIGAGCDLTSMCDIRIASENATFAESFVKVSIVPGDGGAWLLPRAVGRRSCGWRMVEKRKSAMKSRAKVAQKEKGLRPFLT
jgi:enoyl-CoA hydratase/carnithine racemase